MDIRNRTSSSEGECEAVAHEVAELQLSEQIVLQFHGQSAELMDVERPAPGLAELLCPDQRRMRRVGSRRAETLALGDANPSERADVSMATKG